MDEYYDSDETIMFFQLRMVVSIIKDDVTFNIKVLLIGSFYENGWRHEVSETFLSTVMLRLLPLLPMMIETAATERDADRTLMTKMVQHGTICWWDTIL